MNKVKIIKAKITKDLTIEKIGFVETNPDKTKKTVDNAKGDWIAHKDLVDAFNKLTPHFILLCEQPEASNISEDNIDSIGIVPDYEVSSFTISGEDEHEGFSISGTKLLENGKKLVLNTPFMQWDEGYRYMSEVGEAIQSLQYHVHQYFFDHVQAPKRQQSMEDVLYPKNVEGQVTDDSVKQLKGRRKKNHDEAA